MVKPILKKRSHSEKNSLDLDRPWEEQQISGPGGWGPSFEPTGLTGTGRSARDVNFSFSETSMLPGGKPRYQHARSLSGTSHVSVATTASGGSRPSAFAHPFQQTPRTQTPPLTFANSAASLDNVALFNSTGANSTRDYSPTITENEDDDDYPVGSLPTHRYRLGYTTPFSQASGRHPTLVNQRAASFSDINAAPPLRLNTARSVPGSRRGPGSSSLSSSLSHSDLHLNATGGPFVLDSPESTAVRTPSLSFAPYTLDGVTTPSAAATSPRLSNDIVAPNTNAAAFPIRSSLEGIGLPRLRSYSELDAGARADQIREARRKFEERERAKAEKHDREMMRKRGKQAAAQLRKNSGTGSDGIRPSLSRKSTPTFTYGSGNGSGSGIDHEKGRESGKSGRPAPEVPEKPLAFKSSNYDSMTGGMRPSFGPSVDRVAVKNQRRNKSTKHKTQGYWNGFVLWLRTRLFRLGRK